MYQVMIKQSEGRNSAMAGPLNFATKEERLAYVKGPAVYWYFFPEDDDWHVWHRGGAWKATQQPAAADRENIPPDITDKDRRW
jgi:hypothetical protein